MTNSELAQHTGDMGAFDASDQALVQYLGLNPGDPKSRAVVAVCRRYNLDPLLKHVIVIPKGGVYITRDGLLNVAHRSGQLDGIVVDQEPTLVDGEWTAKVTVYRKDMSHGFSFPGRYPQSGSNRQYAPEMALKAAEAHALRRAFDINGLPALDEQRPPEPQQQPRVSASDFTPVSSDGADQDGNPRTAQDVSDAEVVEDEPTLPADGA